jgi:hypothetical protein
MPKLLEIKNFWYPKRVSLIDFELENPENLSLGNRGDRENPDMRKGPIQLGG